MIRLIVWVCALVALVVGCGEPAPAAPDATVGDWRCPATWVRHARGGCGPAVLLCVPDGGAAAGACEGVDLSRPPVVDDGDGGVATGFWRAPDGAIRGAWKEPGEPGGPPARDWHPPALDGLEERVPAADWVPDAGIPSCPEGWARTSDGVCDPRLPDDCPEGSGPLPGGQCTRTALRDCPAGEWPDPGAEAVGAQVLRVREGADDARADGSATRPYGTISAAIAAAREGAWVLVAAGTYRERLRVARGVHVLGLCAARVSIVEPTPTDPTSPLVTSAAEAPVSYALRGLTLRGGGVAVVADFGARLDAREITVGGSSGVIRAQGRGTAVTVADVFYDGSEAPASEAFFDVLRASLGASVDASRCHVSRARRFGARCLLGGATLTVRDSAFRGGRAVSPALGESAAIAATAGCTTTVQRVAVLDNAAYGILAVTADTLVRVEDAVVRGTRAFEGDGGSGLFALMSGRMEARRVFVDDSETCGVLAFTRGAALLEQAVVRGTRPGTSVTVGAGIGAGYAGRVDVRRTVVERNQGVGATAFAPSSELSIVESVVRDNTVGPGGVSGFGLAATDDGWLSARRVLVLRSAQLGVQVSRRGRASLSWMRVSDTRADNLAGIGVGLYVDTAGHLTASGLRVQRATTADVSVADSGSLAALEDVWFDTASGAGQAFALRARRGGGLFASRVRVGAGHAFGAAADGDTARLELTDGLIEALAPSSPTVVAGLAAVAGGRLDATRVVLLGGTGVGAMTLEDGPQLTLRDVLVRGFRATDSDTDGFGVFVRRGGSAALARLHVFDTEQVGIGHNGDSLLLEDSVIDATLPLRNGLRGGGILVESGVATLRRVLLRDNHNYGLGVIGGAVDARDLAVFDTTAAFDGTESTAVVIAGGARASLQRVAAVGNGHSAFIAQDPETRVVATDLLIADTRPTRLGFGVGVAAFEGAAVSLTRASVTQVHGFAVAATPRARPGASVEAQDLYVGEVLDQPVRNTFPPGAPVAYGVFVGAGCRADLARAALVDAGWGFFQTAGRLGWRQGVIVRPRDGPGAVNGVGATSSTTLERVRFIDAVTQTVSRDVALPEVLLPPPPPPCALPPCGAR